LASDDSSFVAGVELSVDGGMAHDLGRRFASRRIIVRGATFGGDSLAEGGNRNCQHMNTYNYLNLTNYVNNFKRLGFTDADLTPPGSDKFIDALVAYGTPDDIANRLREHRREGADHVVIQVIGGADKLLPTLTGLASALG
jgi:hypothetical protein